ARRSATRGTRRARRRPAISCGGPDRLQCERMATNEPQLARPAHGPSDLEAVKEVARARTEIVREIEKRIIGQRAVIDQLLTALFARGHCLFVGVPGLAKTLLISTLAETLNLSFQRIQFTPDLMPSDITGTDVLEED